jgi:hypothetical protein
MKIVGKRPPESGLFVSPETILLSDAIPGSWRYTQNESTA